MEKILLEIQQDVREIKENLAVNNHILNEHHKRSTSLEERMRPIEDDYKFRNRLLTVLFGSGGVLAASLVAFKIYQLLK